MNACTYVHGSRQTQSGSLWIQAATEIMYLGYNFPILGIHKKQSQTRVPAAMGKFFSNQVLVAENVARLTTVQ